MDAGPRRNPTLLRRRCSLPAARRGQMAKELSHSLLSQSRCVGRQGNRSSPLKRLRVEVNEFVRRSRAQGGLELNKYPFIGVGVRLIRIG